MFEAKSEAPTTNQPVLRPARKNPAVVRVLSPRRVTTAATAKADDSKDGVICTYEKPTGSFLKEKKCTTAAEREAERQRNSIMDVRNSRDSGLAD